MESAEVVVTGLGMVTPLGATASESAAAWCAGQSANRSLLPELAGTPLEDAHVAELPPLTPAERLGGGRMLKFMSKAAVLGSVAAHEAAAQGRLSERFAPERVGLFAATGLAGANLQDVLPMIEASIGADGAFSSHLLGERGLATTNPLLSFRILPNMPPCIASIIEQIKGPNYIFTPWEGQGAAALVEAWRAVASGEVDAALAGAADDAAHPATFVFLRQSGLLGADEYPASGAAYLLLERAEGAQRDGQPPWARVASMELHASDVPPRDPVAPRLGRVFAAAPAIAMALGAASLAGDGAGRYEGEVRGIDGHQFRFVLEGVR